MNSSGDDGDFDESSVVGQAAHTARDDISSVRGLGLASASASDWEDSTTPSSSRRHHQRNDSGVGSSVVVNAVTSFSAAYEASSPHASPGGSGGSGGSGGGVGGGGRAGPTVRVFHWWSSLLSRVSRSASSLLNQHSPNLNDFLDDDAVGGGGGGGGGGEDNPLVSAAVLDAPRPGPSGGGGGVSPVDIIEDGEAERAREATELRAEVARLKERLVNLELELNNSRGGVSEAESMSDSRSKEALEQETDTPAISLLLQPPPTTCPRPSPQSTLAPEQITRYSRQLLLNDGFGVSGQLRMINASVLVVGAGGIGSTVLMYLAAAGVGHITVADHDSVEMSNLHRQIIHRDPGKTVRTDDDDGDEQRPAVTPMNKARSAIRALRDLNPTVSCTAHEMPIDFQNATDLVSNHDVVVDATDNPLTRYLLNDACVLAGRTLVSGSAMGTEGQLSVYNYRRLEDGLQERRRSDGSTTTATTTEAAGQRETENSTGGGGGGTACYRCLYPNPNPTEGCKSCSDNGVLGPVPGLIGVLQAVEVIKVLTGIGHVVHDKLLMYDSLECSFLRIKKPPRRKNCAVCSPTNATIRCMEDSENSLTSVRGPSVCGIDGDAAPPVGTVMPLLAPERNVSCAEFHDQVREKNVPHVLLDVRVPRQYEMCSLDRSVNLPLEQLMDDGDCDGELRKIEEMSGGTRPVYCLCRRGIASAEATRIIQEAIEEKRFPGIHSVYNLRGGLNSWVRNVDPNFPQY